MPVPRLKHLVIVRSAYRLEQSLSLPVVDKQRQQFLSILATRASRDEIQSLLHASTGYQSGDVSEIQFYRLLEDVGVRHSVSFSHYPGLGSYVDYVRLSASLAADAIFQDLQKLERQRWEQVIANEPQRWLVGESRMLVLTKKLIDFQLTKEEWAEYQQLKTFHATLSLAARLVSFEDFYREAQIRDERMADNFLKLTLPSVSVLVTGGFHSSGIDQKLLSAGYTVVQFVPKMTRLDARHGSDYLSVFSQQKTPLSKLFLGEKLFLADRAMGKDVHMEAVNTCAGLGAVLGVGIDELREWFDRVALDGWRLLNVNPSVSTVAILEANAHRQVELVFDVNRLRLHLPYKPNLHLLLRQWW